MHATPTFFTPCNTFGENVAVVGLPTAEYTCFNECLTLMKIFLLYDLLGLHDQFLATWGRIPKVKFSMQTNPFFVK